MKGSVGPASVNAANLSFEPTRSWVYYCATCEEFLDTEDVAQHADSVGDDVHEGSARMGRVEVVES